MNINSLCGKCKYLKKCHADKRIVIECKRYEPTEEYEKIISEVKKY
jgi:ribosomal protein S17